MALVLPPRYSRRIFYGCSLMAASVGSAVDHQALRDTLLLYDGVSMLMSLPSGKPQDASATGIRPSADESCSAYLRAILDACCHPTSPPTLRQLLSHPYFAPVEGFDQEDVRAAYKRWRQPGNGRGPI